MDFFSFFCLYCFSSSWLQTSWSWLHTNVSCWTHFSLLTHVVCFWTVIEKLFTSRSDLNTPAKDKNPPCSIPLSLEQSKCWPAGLQIIRSLLSEYLITELLCTAFIIDLLLLNTGRVFVTYEADNDKHVNEIINFVALLRHNGFDTHVCTGFRYVLAQVEIKG